MHSMLNYPGHLPKTNVLLSSDLVPNDARLIQSCAESVTGPAPHDNPNLRSTTLPEMELPPVLGASESSVAPAKVVMNRASMFVRGSNMRSVRRR